MCFGLKDFSKTVGVVILAATLGSSTGPLFVGMLYDINGDYKLALAALIALGMMGIITATFIRRPRSFEIVTER
jgi:cyanate permease